MERKAKRANIYFGTSEPGQSSAIIATRSQDDFVEEEEVEDDIEVEKSEAAGTGSCTRQHAKYPRAVRVGILEFPCGDRSNTFHLP